MKNDQKSAGGSIEYKWMTSDRTTQTLSARTDFNKIQNEMIAEIATPMGTSSVNGRLTYVDHDSGMYRTTITMVMGANSYRGKCEFNRQERSIDAKIYYTQKISCTSTPNTSAHITYSMISTVSTMIRSPTL